MEISFLTPIAGLVALAVILPLIAFVRSEQRTAHVRSLLGLAGPGGSRRLVIGALALLAVLAGIGAAQPVLEQTREHGTRTDAQAFFLFDTSRSMLASAAQGEPTRFDRARTASERLRDALSEVPIGVASVTDRVLPLVFPSPSPDTFDRVMRYSIGVDRPPASEAENKRVSSLNATVAVPERNFFRGGGERRLLVIFTDAETRRIDSQLLATAFGASAIDTILIRFGKPGEKVWGPGGGPEPYEPDPTSAAAARSYAAAVGGRAFDENDLDEAIAAARETIGTGRTSVRVEASDVKPLGPFVFLVALAPLSFLLWRRNLV
jgi:hypothetical protein